MFISWFEVKRKVHNDPIPPHTDWYTRGMSSIVVSRVVVTASSVDVPTWLRVVSSIEVVLHRKQRLSSCRAGTEIPG